MPSKFMGELEGVEEGDEMRLASATASDNPNRGEEGDFYYSLN